MNNEIKHIQTLQDILGPRCPKCGEKYLEIVNAKYTFFFIHKHPKKQTTIVDGHEIHEKMAAIKCAVDKRDLVDLELPHWYHIMKQPNRMKILKPLLKNAQLPITPPPTPSEFMEIVTKGFNNAAARNTTIDDPMDDVISKTIKRLGLFIDSQILDAKNPKEIVDSLVENSKLQVELAEAKTTIRQMEKDYNEKLIAKDALMDHMQRAMKSMDALLEKTFWAAHNHNGNLPAEIINEISYSLKIDLD